MPALNSGELTELILQNELVIGDAAATLRQQSQTITDARDLAQDLIRRDWLTPYQVNQLFLGKVKELALGPYIFLERLGEGGMGQVFKAKHRTLGRVVALKVIRKECVNNERVKKRFQREMRAIRQLNHPNIVHAYDADEIDGLCCIAMEFVEGIDLAKLIKRSGPLDVIQACDFIRQAALGLQHAHDQSLVHRDIKPANLFLTRPTDRRGSSTLPLAGKDGHAQPSGVHARPSGVQTRPSGILPRPDAPDYPWGVVKILDLGLARWTDADNDRSHLTQLGTVMGTPDFIAPEQARNSSECDIRADIYSLGCSFYFLLTGRVPFPSGTLTEKLLHHQSDQPELASTARRKRLLEGEWVNLNGTPSPQALDIPDSVLAVLARSIAKKPEQRQQAPLELAYELTDVLAQMQRPKRSRPVPVEAARAALPTVARATPTEARSPASKPDSTDKTKPAAARPAAAHVAKPRWTPRRLVVLASVGVALVAGMVLAAVSNRGDRPQAAQPTPARSKDVDDVRPIKIDGDDAALQAMRSKVRDGKFDAAEVRRDIIRFRLEHFGKPVAREAVSLMSQLPSPLDAIDRSRLEKFPKWERIPPEVVAVLGAMRPLEVKLDAKDGKPPEIKPFQSIAFSPDGSLLAAAGEDTPLRLWSTDLPAPPLKLFGLTGRPPSRVVFAPDGKSFVTVSSEGVSRVWDSASRTWHKVLERQPRPIQAVAYHPRGTWAATAGADGKVRLWDPVAAAAEPGAEQHQWDAGADLVSSLTFTPNGRFLFWSGRMSEVRWVDLEAPGDAPRALKHKNAMLRTLAFEPDGRLLLAGAASGHVAAFTWDGSTLTETSLLKEHNWAVHDLAVSPDGKQFVTVGADRQVILWEVGKPTPLQTWTLNWAVNAVAYAPDGRHFATANGNGSIFIFRPHVPEKLATR